jgi:hypothetical protein
MVDTSIGNHPTMRRDDFRCDTVCLEVAAGRECYRGATAMNEFAPRERRIIAEFDRASVHWIDASNGIATSRAPIDPIACSELTEDRQLLVCPFAAEKSIFEGFAAKAGISWPFRSGGFMGARLYAASTGRHIGTLPSLWSQRFPMYGTYGLWRLGTTRTNVGVELTPDGQTLAVPDPDSINDWQLWHVPPRPSSFWFSLSCGLLGLPILFLARRRVQKRCAV